MNQNNSKAGNINDKEAGAGSSGMPKIPLPPTFPPNVNPETYKLEEVSRLLKSAVYYSVFNIANPNKPNNPVLLIPGLSFLMTAVNVNEELHRFEISVEVAAQDEGLRAYNRIGESVANVRIRWTPMPDDFQAAPDKYPPTTILNPFRSQRFSMLEGELKFKDKSESGFRAFGTGRTFPTIVGQENQLRIGAVIDILEGFGEFAGLPGTMVVNGHINPPDELALSLIIRIMDPQNKLKKCASLRPSPAPYNPDPDTLFLAFLGEVDPDRPVRLNIDKQGRILGSQVFELLRLVDLDFAIGQDGRLEAKNVEGSIVGTVEAKLYFNPLEPQSIQPIQTTKGVFTFYNPKGRRIGTINSNMVEGRAIRTELKGAPMPVFRFGGFGPICGGTGYFAGAAGMMSMNSVVSVFPRTLSNLYILRLSDPQGRFRAELHNNWK